MPRRSEKIPVIVVDDNKADQLLLRSALSDAKVANPVSFCGDGQELLDLLRSGAPEPGFVLMDLNMPRLSGKAALQALRADPQLAHLVVLIVSTSAFEAEVRECYRLGANAFLVKPFEYDDFVRLLGETCAYWLGAVELPVPSLR